MNTTLRLGTRGSRLALIQANLVKDAILEKNPSLTIEIVPISTHGDVDKTTSLRDMGGKGVFIKDIEQGLLDTTVDIAIHSFKDVTCDLAPGCTLAGFLPAESKHDVLVCRPGEVLTPGMRIGTGSIRRHALLKHQFKDDFDAVSIRGNVETRIRKCDDGEVDAVILSEAGLIRLGLEARITQRFYADSFYPAPGQGVIALECREDDDEVKALCASLTSAHQQEEMAILCRILRVVGFDCRDPFGCDVLLGQNDMTVMGFVASQDIQHFYPHSLRFSRADKEQGVGEWIAAIQEARQSWE